MERSDKSLYIQRHLPSRSTPAVLTTEALPSVLLLGLLYGTTLIVSRFSVGQYAPLTYIALRLVLGSCGMVVLFAALLRRRWPRSLALWKQAALLGIVGTALPMIGVIGSLAYQSSGVTALLMTTAPAITVLLAHFFLPEERLDWRKAGGIALALGGAGLLILRGETGLRDVTAASPIGYALVLGGITLESLTIVYSRRYLRQADVFDIAGSRMIVAMLVVLPLSLALVGFDLSGVSAVGYAGLLYAAAAGTFGGLLLSFHITQRHGATAVSLTSYIIPVVAAVGGVLLLGEQVTSTMLAGMALIIGGVAFLHEPQPLDVDEPV